MVNILNSENDLADTLKRPKPLENVVTDPHVTMNMLSPTPEATRTYQPRYGAQDVQDEVFKANRDNTNTENQALEDLKNEETTQVTEK